MIYHMTIPPPFVLVRVVRMHHQTYTSIGKMVGEETAQQLAYVAGANRLGLYEKGIFKCDGEARPNETAAEVGGVHDGGAITDGATQR